MGWGSALALVLGTVMVLLPGVPPAPALVAGLDAAAGLAFSGPDAAPDPLTCTERLELPHPDQAIDARWAPDSAHLAITRIATSPSSHSATGFEEDPVVAVLDLASGAVSELGPGMLPEWSGNGTYLSYWREGRLFITHGGGVAAIVEPSMPVVRWVGDQLVYWSGAEIRGWTAEADVAIASVAVEYVPLYPRDWIDFSADGALFTLTRYRMDGAAERYVGQVRNGHVAALESAGTTYTEWAPRGQTLLVRSDTGIELRGADGFHAVAPVTAFPGPVHGWTADGRLLLGRISPTVPTTPAFDRFAAWSGGKVDTFATLPNLLGSRSFSPNGRYFAGMGRNGLYESALEVYRCGGRTAAAAAVRAHPVARARQERIDGDPRRFVRPVMGYISQFLQGAHTGVDVAAPLGAIVTSSDDGLVTFVGWRPVGGRVVCVAHGDGLESCYYHSSLALVQPGQRVARGEPVALVGMSGLTTGPHVHWEATRDGTIVDPFRR